MGTCAVVTFTDETAPEVITASGPGCIPADVLVVSDATIFIEDGVSALLTEDNLPLQVE